MARLLDDLAILGVFVGTLVAVLASAELGYRWASTRRRNRVEKEAPIGAMAAATLGLLAFLLAFTFGVAEDAYHARKVAVVEEANAIRLTYLLSNVAAPAQRDEIRTVLRQYVDQRLRWANGQPDAPGTSANELLDRLGKATVVVAEQYSGNVDVFLTYSGRVIELQHERVMLREQSRIPNGFWVVVGFLTLLSASSIGYHSGVAETSRSPVLVALAFAFAAVITVIVDIDRPGAGLIDVSQQPMLDLRGALQESKP
jgi:hypothetical protein